MRVVLDGSPWQRPPTGIAKATGGLYRACAQLEAPPEVIALHRKPLACPSPQGVTAVLWGGRLPRTLWRSCWLPHCANALHADVLHCPSNGSGAPAFRPRAAVVMTLFDVLPLEMPAQFLGNLAEPTRLREYRQRTQRAIDAADGIITCSEYSRSQILAHFRCHVEPQVIPLGPSIDPLEAALAPNARGDYFVYVGGYDVRKGLETLARIFLRLHQEGRITARLLLTGSPRNISPAFRECVETGRSVGAIEELGYVTDDELVSLLSHARALVYPSKYEGFGLPALDAMSLGCPVLTARSTALPEVCGDAALYADPDDEEPFAEALIALQVDDGLRAALAQKGRAQAARFQWAASARKFMDWLSALVAETQTHGRQAKA